MAKDNHSFHSANPECTSNSPILQNLVLYPSLLKTVGTVFVNFLTLQMFMIRSFFLEGKLSKISNINRTSSLAELFFCCPLSTSSFLHKMSLFVQKPICLLLLQFEIYFSFTNFNLKVNASKSPGVKKKLKTVWWLKSFTALGYCKKNVKMKANGR